MRHVLFFICLLLSACHGSRKDPAPVPPAVTVIAAIQKSIPVYSEYVGQLAGDTDIRVQSRIPGIVTGMYFTEGQKVKKGSLLYTIDPKSLQTQVDQYEAALAQQQTLLGNKKSNLARIRPLAEMKAISQMDLDGAVSDYQAALNQVAIATAQRNDALIQLGYARITAPINGIIGLSKVKPGDMITGSGDNLINTISAVNAMKLSFAIPENDYLRFARQLKKGISLHEQLDGLPVELILADGSVYPCAGSIDLADRQIDPSTGSMIIEASFTNKDDLLRPGQYGKIRIRSGVYDSAILIPQEAVNQIQNVYQVFVLNDSNKLVPRIIDPGAKTGSSWIVRKGIAQGDKVAILGNAFLTQNSR